MRSMSVHSLIDNLQTSEDPLPMIPRPKSEQPLPNLHVFPRSSDVTAVSDFKMQTESKSSDRWRCASTHIEKNPSVGDKESPTKLSFAETVDKPNNVPNRLVHAFFPEAQNYPMSSSLFEEALRVRAEQEKTKQAQINSEIASKNLAIIELATKNGVSPHHLPFMCIGTMPDSAYRSFTQTQSNIHSRRPDSGELNQSAISDNTVLPPQSLSHVNTSPLQSAQDYEYALNASSSHPLNFRFGGTPQFSQPSPGTFNRRPRSPAKLGAAAVANLANPLTPVRPTHRTIPQHQRHYSMPTESVSSSMRGPDLKQGERTHGRQKSQTGLNNAATLHSPLGGTSMIQVRPSPAQPLHKQTKNSQIPSQESMTSFQHVIQFQHWKPDHTDEKNIEKPETNNQGSQTFGFGHKRHKSSNMSIDLPHDENLTSLSQKQQFDRKSKQESHEGDVSMELSDTNESKGEVAE